MTSDYLFILKYYAVRNSKCFPKICENVSKTIFSPQNQGHIPRKWQKKIIIWMGWALANIYGKLSLIHSWILFCRKLKIFPKLCENVSKNYVFSPKSRSHALEMAKVFIVWVGGLKYMTNDYLITFKYYVMRNNTLFQKIFEQCLKLTFFTPKIDKKT